MRFIGFFLLGFTIMTSAVSCSQKNPDALLKIGNRLFEAGKWEEAKKTYLKITEVAPEYAMAYYNLGIMDWQAKQYETAEGYFSQAIERDPMYARAYLMRGRCYFKLNEFKMAENDFQTARVNPEVSFEGLSELGRLWVSQSRFA